MSRHNLKKPIRYWAVRCFLLWFAGIAAVGLLLLAAMQAFVPLPESSPWQGLTGYDLLLMMLCGVLVSGLGTVLLLVRRLKRPITAVNGLAAQLLAGDNRIEWNEEYPEREVHDLMLVFKELSDRLSSLEALRTQLLAGVTHELKTPVTTIHGLVQALKDRIVKGKEADTFMEVCLKECDRLHRMVEDLLEFNRFAANTVTVIKEPCSLKDVLQDAAERWRLGQEQLRCKVVLESSDDKGNWLTNTDPARLQQILINLLNNARDAMASGGIITILLLRDPGQFRILVTDTGNGIPAEERHDIFEPFFRGKLKKARVHGLGLGLPFSRLVARSLGGELQLVESSSSGTTFAVLIPISTE